MKSELRIPTLLGLALIFGGLIAGGILVSQNQIFRSSASQSEIPKEISVFNISPTSASIFWQTDKETAGFVQIVDNQTSSSIFNDERDGGQLGRYKLHFVNLTGLTPQTTYLFKINSGASTYPLGEPLSLETSPLSEPGNLKPLIGTVVDATLSPLKEALIVLETPKVGKLAAITKASGNFILPLASIQKEMLSGDLGQPEASLSARLTVSSPEQITSVVTLKIPYPDTVLPPITLGTNMDITPPPPPASPTPGIKYDLNNDGVINSLDRSIILKNFGKKPKLPAADLNSDNVVDKKDLEIINQLIPPKPER